MLFIHGYQVFATGQRNFAAFLLHNSLQFLRLEEIVVLLAGNSKYLLKRDNNSIA